MPEFDQMVDEVRSRLLVLTTDLIEMVPCKEVDEDGREVMCGEVPQGMLAAFGPGCDQQPIDPPLVQSSHDLQLAAGVLVRFCQQEHVAELRELRFNCVDQVREVGIRNGGNGQTDRASTSRSHRRHLRRLLLVVFYPDVYQTLAQPLAKATGPAGFTTHD